MEEERSPAKKLKVVQVEKDVEGSSSIDNQLQSQQPNLDVAKSPVTEPMLMPEMWSHVLEFLSPDELQTVINTTPECNCLLHSQKPKILFPKVLECMRGYLSWEDALPFRMVSKACRTGVDVAYPRMRTVITFAEVTLRAAKDIPRSMDVRGRILLGMQHEARNRERVAQGLPAQEFRCEERVREDEFSEEEIQAFLTRRFEPPQ